MRALAASLLSLLLLASCAGGHGRAPCPAGQRCLEVGNSSEAQTLDPAKAQMVNESNVLYDMLIGLTTFDAKGRTVPGMATRWETSADGLVWTFHLRNARWSDGVPVTAGDFVAALRRVELPRTASPYAYLLYLIAGAQAVNEGKAAPETIGARAIDDRTLELRLVHPAPYLPLLLVHTSAMPVPAHAIARWGDAWVQPGHYVSNGPYVLESWALNDRLVLRRSPRFYEAQGVCFDRVSYYPITDPVSGERRIETGELDATNSFASNRVGYLRRKLPGYVRSNPILATYYLSFNSHVPALADRRVRLALSIAIDRAFIAGRLLRAGQTPAYAFVPPGMANYRGIPRPAWAGWPLPFRQAVARALLRRAGYGPDRPLSLEMKYATSGEALVRPALQADWRAIGAHIQLTPEEGQILYADLNARAFDLGSDSWYLDFDDPLTFLQLLATSGGAQNHASYSNPRYDALLAAADQERDIRRRAAMLERAETIAMADAPVAPLYVASARNLVNAAITGWFDNISDWHPKRFLCRRGA